MGDDFKGAITGSHISLASYYRIALPSLLPDVDKIIYCDADVINFKDLSEMYNLKFRDKI
jgi:lipopolysaccharide biosynthesis glycosyltransferase